MLTEDKRGRGCWIEGRNERGQPQRVLIGWDEAAALGAQMLVRAKSKEWTK